MKRRAVVTTMGIGFASVSGCVDRITGAVSSDGVSDLQISNQTDSSVTVTIRAVTDGEEVFNREFKLEPDDGSSETKTFDEVAGNEPATIIVSVGDGQETKHNFTDDKQDAQGVIVRIYAERIEFQNYSG